MSKEFDPVPKASFGVTLKDAELRDASLGNTSEFGRGMLMTTVWASGASMLLIGAKGFSSALKSFRYVLLLERVPGHEHVLGVEHARVRRWSRIPLHALPQVEDDRLRIGELPALGQPPANSS